MSSDSHDAAKSPPSRPNIPYDLLAADEGTGLMSWDDLSAKMRDALSYWLATTRPDGRPHVVPVWGVWLDETFYFSTGPTTVNARNLAANPAIAIHLESGEDAVILEGRAEPVSEPSLVGRINEVYVPKYDEDHPMQHFYALRTNVAFAWLCRGTGRSAERDFQGSPTRWRFARS